MLEEKTTDEETPSPEKTIQIEKKYARFSTASMILGCLFIGFYSWFAILQFDIIAHWFGGVYSVPVVNSVLLLSTIIGIIFGAISVKRGIKKRAIIGMVFNSIVVIFHVYGIVYWILLILKIV